MNMGSKDVGAVNTIPIDDKVNYVPDDAIEASERARKAKPKLVQSPKIDEKKSDPFREDRVAADVPSNEEVKKTPPDSTVNPG